MDPFLSIVIRHTEGSLNRPASSFLVGEQGGSYVAENETTKIRLKRRSDYPVTYIARKTADAVQFGYGENATETDDEFLHCSVDTRGNVRVIRDVFGTLPLFFAQSQDLFIISNDYNYLIAQLPQKTLSRGSFVNSLIAGNLPPDPYIEEVRILWPQEILFYDGKKVSVEKTPPKWSLQTESHVANPYDFAEGLSTYFDRFIATRLEGQSVAFELSGGLDSATLPQYIAMKRGHTPLLASIILHDPEFQASQSHKINAIKQSTNGTLFTAELDPHRSFPLSRMVLSNDYKPSYQESLYFEPKQTLLRQLQREGVTVISRGIGGDELFSNGTSGMDGTRISEKTVRGFHKPAYLTPRFHEAFETYRPKNHPTSHLPVSINYVALQNNYYIQHGIWPVSPFVSPSLLQWTRTLPIQYRSNKNILRAYHQAHGFVPEIYNASQNEDFSRFFRECFRVGSYDPLVAKLIPNSVAIREGYVDSDKLLETYSRLKSDPDLYGDDAFALYIWMIGEINAQHG